MKFSFRRKVFDYRDKTYVYYFYVDDKCIDRWTIYSLFEEGVSDYVFFIKGRGITSNKSLVQLKKTVVEEYCKRSGVEKL